MGAEGSFVQSRKQNLNTKSSNEYDIIEVDDALTQVIWA